MNVKSYKSVDLDYGKFMPELNGSLRPQPKHYYNSTLVIIDKSLYIITPKDEELHIFRLRPGEVVFSMIQKINLSELGTKTAAAKTARRSDVGEKNGNSKVNNQAVYVEYKNRLFKLNLNRLEFTETRLIDTAKQRNWNINRGFKLAASAETVYVGTKNGKLLQSIDGGDNWRNVTPNILTNFTHIKDMIWVGTTIYIATDKGVLSSKTGEQWRVLTDHTGTHINIDRFAKNEHDIYGANSTSIYQLDSHGKWEQISSNVPDSVISLAVNRNRVYIATKQHGIFHTSIKEETTGIRTVKNFPMK